MKTDLWASIAAHVLKAIGLHRAAGRREAVAAAERAANRAADIMRSTVLSEILDGWERCESEIERVLLAALMVIEVPAFSNDWQMSYPFPKPGVSTRRSFADAPPFKPQQEFFAIYPQEPLLSGKYRADLLFVAKFQCSAEPTLIVIECDGHDFHERTKEQAARDRQRDRDLTAAGYKVFRFTGSEIWRDAEKCAAEVQDFLEKHEHELRERRDRS